MVTWQEACTTYELFAFKWSSPPRKTDWNYVQGHFETAFKRRFPQLCGFYFFSLPLQSKICRMHVTRDDKSFATQCSANLLEIGTSSSPNVASLSQSVATESSFSKEETVFPTIHAKKKIRNEKNTHTHTQKKMTTTLIQHMNISVHKVTHRNTNKTQNNMQLPVGPMITAHR